MIESEQMMALAIDFNKQRSSGAITHVICAKCGGNNAISNREVLPWQLKTITIDETGRARLFRLVWTCTHCHEEYDLGLLKT